MKKKSASEDPGPSVKDNETYNALRRDGASKEKAARIANAKAAGDNPGKKGGQSSNYEDRTKDELYEQAKEIGIEGRSGMSKQQLIDVLRNH
mgnify:CR=1 FL=1